MRLASLSLLLTSCVCFAQNPAAAPARLKSPEYAQVQQRLSRGWNTWDTQSVTTHVLLPEGLGVRVGVLKKMSITGDSFLPTALSGRLNADAEQVFPGPHAYDGSYTDLRLTWQGQSLRIQSGTDSGDLVVLLTPLTADVSKNPPVVVFSVGFLWNRPGTVARNTDGIAAHSSVHSISFFLDGKQTTAFDAPVTSPYFAADLEKPVAL